MMSFRTVLLLLAVFASATFAEAQVAAPTKAADTPTSMNNAEIHYVNLVERFKKENATLPSDKTNIVFLGDSITEGYHLKEFFPNLPTVNRGIGSDVIVSNIPGRIQRGILNRMDNSLYDCHPRALFLLIGTNHMGNSAASVEDLFKDYTKIIELALVKIPTLKIALTTLPPSGVAYAKWGKPEVFNPRAVKFNELIRAYAKEKNFPVIDLEALLKDDTGMLNADFTGDGIHLKKAAYDLWTAEVKKILAAWGEKLD